MLGVLSDRSETEVSLDNVLMKGMSSHFSGLDRLHGAAYLSCAISCVQREKWMSRSL